MRNNKESHTKAIEYFKYVVEMSLMWHDRAELLRMMWYLSPEFRDFAADVDCKERNELVKFDQRVMNNYREG